jgi:hypothetical protein
MMRREEYEKRAFDSREKRRIRGKILEKLVSSSQKARCSSLNFYPNGQQMSASVFFSKNVCMKNSDHRKMSLIFRLEYYGANKRDV